MMKFLPKSLNFLLITTPPCFSAFFKSFLRAEISLISITQSDPPYKHHFFKKLFEILKTQSQKITIFSRFQEFSPKDRSNPETTFQPKKFQRPRKISKSRNILFFLKFATCYFTGSVAFSTTFENRNKLL